HKTIKKNEIKGVNELQSILTYKQERMKYQYPANGKSVNCYIEVSKDKVVYKNDHQMKICHIVEFEVKDQSMSGANNEGQNRLSPQEKIELLNKFWAKLRTLYPKIDDRIYYETRLDWALSFAPVIDRGTPNV
ncbi:MAG: hypothetical protein ACUVQP_00985, partial [Bacteroidales bacterium]